MSGKKLSGSSRRKFLQLLGMSGLAVSAENSFSQIRVLRQDTTAPPPPGQDYIAVHLTRPQDLLSLELRFSNFTLSGKQLIKKADPAYMMVLFQPQSIAESAGTETIQNGSNTLMPPSFPAKMLMAYRSRLVFKISKSSIGLNANELLAWENYELVVNSRAKGVGNNRIAGSAKINEAKLNALAKDKKINAQNIGNIKGLSKDEKIYFTQLITTNNTNILANLGGAMNILSSDPVSPPGMWETSLEIPFRLHLSPTKNAGWKHSIKLKQDNGIIKSTNKLFELWHTRLANKTTFGLDDSDLSFEQRVLRILWGNRIDKDYKNIPPAATDPTLGITSLSDRDRHQLVHESSNFVLPNFVPQPVKAYKLFLTGLGAYLDSIFTVDFKKIQQAGLNLSILKWRHIQTLAREHYVEIVEAGYIMPFGHEAVLIKITERKPHKASATATNFQRRLVVITEVSKDFGYRDGNGKYMEFCFNKIDFITTHSPLIDESINAGSPFAIKSDNKEVEFKIHAEDLNDNEVNFSMPLTFVSNTILNAGSVGGFCSSYISGNYSSRYSNLSGQQLSLAPTSQNAVSTSFETHKVMFGAKEYPGNANEPQGFMPILSEASIIEPSYQKLTGKKDVVPVSLEDDNNAGNVFAKFNFSQAINFAGNAAITGGFAVPNFNLSGLSKAAGAFGGDLNDFKSAIATADKFFNASGGMPDPTLFGVFKLSDIIDFVSSDKLGYDLSKTLSERMNGRIPNLSTTETPEAFITTYNLASDLKNYPFKIGDLEVVNFAPTINKGIGITTQATIKKGKDGVPLAEVPNFKTEAFIKAFDVELLNKMIVVRFQSISFTASPGKSADINVTMKDKPLVFGGPLSFIEAFNSLIPSNGFSDPPYLDVTAAGVKCGYTLALPNLQLGMFALSHLSLGAEVNLPFTGSPMTLGFRFCERQQPFTLQVSFLGGGGFFGMEADLHGLRQIEAALEFGACASINLGVASGAASVMAGIYFKMIIQSGQNSTQLTGYLRINGALSILGLITASIELYMALTYLIDKGKAYGEASVSVKVEVLFFSKTVSVHTSRTFAGSGNDPNFRMGYSKDQWQYYCESFAA